MPVNKYNIYVICKNEEIFRNKAKILNDKYKGKICHIQWVPAEYLTLTQCNRPLLKKLKTLYNTKKKSIIAKLGCIAAHRKALLAIFSNQTHNNLIIEEDAGLMNTLPLPPGKSCYMGGWIVPPLISHTGKVKIDISPHRGINKIDYDKFKIVTTHALFIKDHDEATELLDMTIQPEKLKPYDIFLANEMFFKDFYYPSIFVQESHKSEIDDKGADLNYYRTYNYGLEKPKEKGKLKKTKRKKKTKGGGTRRVSYNTEQSTRDCSDKCTTKGNKDKKLLNIRKRKEYTKKDTKYLIQWSNKMKQCRKKCLKRTKKKITITKHKGSPDQVSYSGIGSSEEDHYFYSSEEFLSIMHKNFPNEIKDNKNDVDKWIKWAGACKVYCD